MSAVQGLDNKLSVKDLNVAPSEKDFSGCNRILIGHSELYVQVL